MAIGVGQAIYLLRPEIKPYVATRHPQRLLALTLYTRVLRQDLQQNFQTAVR